MRAITLHYPEELVLEEMRFQGYWLSDAVLEAVARLAGETAD